MLPGCPKNPSFRAVVSVTNTGCETLEDWELSWSFLGDQSVEKATKAEVHQDGAMVTLTPKHPKKLRPGRTGTFVVTGHRGDLAVPTPGTFFLNGQACRTR